MDYYIGNKHYIDVDDRGRIVDGWSDGPQPQRQPTEQTVQLTDQGGYQFRLHPDGEENPALWDMDGIPLYKYEDGEVLERTQEEIEADRAALPKPEDKPSPEQRIAELEERMQIVLSDIETAYREGVDNYE